jgi:hypothetical protein
MMTEAEEQRPTGDAGDPYADDPLGPPPAALTDDDPLGPPPAALTDEPSRPPHGPVLPPEPTGPSSDNRSLGAIAHLSAFAMFAGVPSFIGPLAIWLFLKDRDQFVATEAREALNFNLSLLIYSIVAIIAMILTLGLGLIVIIPVALVAAPAWLVLTVLAAVSAAEGKPYRYPLTLRLIS